MNKCGTDVHQELADSRELVKELTIVKENLVKENEDLKTAIENKKKLRLTKCGKKGLRSFTEI